MMIWPHAIDRYVLPVVPLLTLGIVVGTLALANRLRGRWRATPWVWLAPAALAFLLYNGTMWGVERWVTNDLPCRYERGLAPSLHEAAAYLRRIPADRRGDVAVSLNFPFKARRESRWQLARGLRRNVTFLLDAPAVEFPAFVEEMDPAGREFREFLTWANKMNVRWLLLLPHQARVFNHFRAPPWRGQPDDVGMQWRLYRIEPDRVVRVEPWGGRRDPAGLPVAVVPGLEDPARLIGGRDRLPLPYN